MAIELNKKVITTYRCCEIGSLRWPLLICEEVNESILVKCIQVNMWQRWGELEQQYHYTVQWPGRNWNMWQTWYSFISFLGVCHPLPISLHLLLPLPVDLLTSLDPLSSPVTWPTPRDSCSSHPIDHPRRINKYSSTLGQWNSVYLLVIWKDLAGRRVWRGWGDDYPFFAISQILLEDTSVVRHITFWLMTFTCQCYLYSRTP